MVNEGLNLVVSNWLFIALLAFMFFFGDWIYNYVKEQTHERTKSVIGDFFIAIISLIILSVLPLIISQFMMDILSIGFNIFISIVLLGLCFWKYYSEE